MEVKLRSGKPRKLSERSARRIARKANQNPLLTAKDLQEDFADSGVVVHCSTCTNMTFMEESSEENLQKFAKEIKLELFGCTSKGVFGEKKKGCRVS